MSKPYSVFLGAVLVVCLMLGFGLAVGTAVVSVSVLGAWMGV